MRRSRPTSSHPQSCSRFVSIFAIILFCLQLGFFVLKTESPISSSSTLPLSAGASSKQIRRVVREGASVQKVRPPPSSSSSLPADECDDWECSGQKQRSTARTENVIEARPKRLTNTNTKDEVTNTNTKDEDELIIGAGSAVKDNLEEKENPSVNDIDAKTTTDDPVQPITNAEKVSKETRNTNTKKRYNGYHRASPDASSSTTSTTSSFSWTTSTATRKQTHVARDFFVENRAVSAADLQRIDSSSITSFIATGGRFPILIVTCDRAEMLAKTLDSISSVRGVTKDDVFVIQDGRNEAVSQVLASRGTKSHKRVDPFALRGNNPMDGPIIDGAQRIAQHYNYALTHMFDSAFPTAPAVIIVEDDFLFSPDFYEYFHAVAPAIEADPTLWLASAWNDNGFDYLVADPFSLRRTAFFPGLGWLLPRKLFKYELQPKWPSTHWDHWMRDPIQHNGRDVIYPEINRNYHAGIKGTFMDSGTHNRYFGSIAMQADPAFTWDTPVGAAAIEEITIGNYERRLLSLLTDKETVHLKSVTEISSFSEGIGVVWYSCPPNEENHNKMRAVAGFFGVWHEGGRGSRDGVHELWWLGSAKLILINAFPGLPPGMLIPGSTMPSSLARAMPVGHVPLEWDAFIAVNRPQLPKHKDLFGAITSSPLSHLDGGDDANGQPDTDASGNTGKGASVIVYVHDAEDEEGEGHEHSKFMGDLSLKTNSRLAGLAKDDNTNDGRKGFGGGKNGESKVGALPANVKIIPSKKSGLSCTNVCEDYNPSSFCISTFLRVINDCSSLKANFPCKACGDSIGSDQPAYVFSPGDPDSGMCLVNGDAKLFSCEGSHAKTQRLCACMDA